VNEGRSDRCAPLDLYANRTAGRAARLAAFAANPGIASKTSASTTRMK
jgi:hypothetical protein